MDPYSNQSLAHRARIRRWTLLLNHFPNFAEMRVIDLGGRADVWLTAPVRPEEVVIVNLELGSRLERPSEPTPWMREVEGNACAPRDLSHLGSFDLVYSNSVIEHVGGHERCLRFAETVHSLGDAHWVQTPWRYFPLEPHWVFPGFQFLPIPLRSTVGKHWPIGFGGLTALRSDPVSAVLWIQLLSVTEMARYFPDSTLLHERIAGITKSIIAVAGYHPPSEPAAKVIK